MTIDEILTYPSKVHVRQEAPPALASYDKFKPYLRREFARTCVYCRTHEVLGGPALFAVEHYLCKKFYPQLEMQYANLFYACGSCNSKKLSWPYKRQGGQWIKVAGLVPNPCDHVMSEHLAIERSNLEIRAKSPTGEFVFDLLGLERRGIEHRKIRDLFLRHREKRAEYRKRRKFARKQLRNPSKWTADERKKILDGLAKVERALQQLDADFQVNFGPAP